MSRLELLKAANTRRDVANILGFKLEAITYILWHKKTPNYKQFEIPKRNGGTRLISAPTDELKKLQNRLFTLLQDCLNEINSGKNINSAISHGFRKKYSIITNAAHHRNKRFVFNIDLDDFFGSINFGRVRNYFIKNNNFLLNPHVATVLAQIACHNHVLPQGSPCSPIISNLIGHILDIRLVKLSNRVGCYYTRYADDLTFSTNMAVFPKQIAIQDKIDPNHWLVGKKLTSEINRSYFKINDTKTRMQYKNSRQDVTGLIVNKKVNTEVSYRHTTRSMVHRLLNTGSFQFKKRGFDDDGNPVIEEVDGNIEQLSGRLSFIDSVNLYNQNYEITHYSKKNGNEKLNGFEQDYRHFLFYKYFHALEKPIIIGEGKTDCIYLQCAIRSLYKDYPSLIKLKKGEKIFKISFLKRSDTTKRLLGLGGGAGEFPDFISSFKKECSYSAAPGKKYPVILIIDNDDGSKKIFSTIKSITGKEVKKTSKFIHIVENLYVILTPPLEDKKDTCIEDFFDDDLKRTKLGGKSFNRDLKTYFSEKEYGKAYFAEYVVKKKQDSINFAKFKGILNRIKAVLREYSLKIE